MAVNTSDVVIVGAGPSGTAAAVVLARAGLDVIVVDKATFPRDKCCGDGLTAGALRLLEDLGLDPATVPSWQRVDDVVVTSPSGRSATLPLPRGQGTFAAVTRRSELDHALVNLAREAGATIVEGAAFSALERNDDRVTIVAGGERYQANYLLAADGMWSPVRKATGTQIPEYRGEWHAFRQYFTNVSPEAASKLHVWFDEDVLPGYIWSFPLPDGGANVGFGIQRGGRYSIQDMRSLWPDLLARPHVAELLGPDATPEARHKAWPIPARVGSIELAAHRVLFIGDAAAATDPMTGEGIGQAILTGVRAAEAVIAGGPGAPTVATDRYRETIAAELAVDHRLAALLSRVLQHPLGARGAVRVAGSTPWVRRNFARWLFEDYPRAVLGTPGRWHREMLSGPGAYRSLDMASADA